MKPILLIDFGSTYTKLTAVDLDNEAILGTSQSYTTVQTDIGNGLNDALKLLEQKIGVITFSERYACSSAAGGLRMITSGLVPELTAEAAKRTSLGAGAKVIKVFSFELTPEDIDEIDAISPDIFLLTGGTDGGNSACILHNASMLAHCKSSFPIVLAGNRSAATACAELLHGREVYRCPNVMPSFGVLNVEPTQKQIRELFLKRIVQAKGLSEAADLVSGILMPTPGAMLDAVRLLAEGCEGESGIGELIAVDLGGATTDVYSVAQGNPQQLNTVLKGLPEPFAKRTVEGDIGMRYSIRGILEAAGAEKIANLSDLSEVRVTELVDYLAQHTDKLPDTTELAKLDFALAAAATEIAVTRHAGMLEQVYTPMGETYVQTGKDLRGVKQVIATGGALVHVDAAAQIVSHTLYNPTQPMSLRPQTACILVDRSYILAAMGLLRAHYPQIALRIMKKELTGDGN